MLDRFNPEEAKTVGRVRKDLFKDHKTKWLKIRILKNQIVVYLLQTRFLRSETVSHFSLDCLILE